MQGAPIAEAIGATEDAVMGRFAAGQADNVFATGGTR
jgi:hypothetical protein